MKNWRIVVADGYRENMRRNAIWKNADPPNPAGRHVRISVTPDFQPNNDAYGSFIEKLASEGHFKITNLTLTFGGDE